MLLSGQFRSKGSQDKPADTVAIQHLNKLVEPDKNTSKRINCGKLALKLYVIKYKGQNYC